MKKSNDIHRYDDIITLPHPISKKHPRMSIENRAAQFSPFAALTGYDAIVEESARLTESRSELDEQQKCALDEKLRFLRDKISENPTVSIVYFQPDLLKFGGEYLRHSAKLKRIDPTEGSLLFLDGKKIPIEDIYEIDW